MLDENNLLDILTKQCQKCNRFLPLTNFNKSKRTKDGICFLCNECKRNKITAYYWDHRKERLAYYHTHREERIAYYNAHKKEHWACIQAYRRTERGRTVLNNAHLKRRLTLKGKLNAAMSQNVHHSLHDLKAGRHWEGLVGYTIDQLKKHLEKQFTPEMNWENYGRGGWHIDHKIPVTAFNFERSEDLDFKRCWDLKNLQPLWARENMSKGAKLKKPFQPSLTI